MYVLGEVSPAEAKQVEQYAQQYPAIAEELRATQEALLVFNEISSIVPSEEVKKHILSKIPTGIFPKPMINGSGNVSNKKDRNGQPPNNFL